jgi:predicted transcriptional regulator
VLHYVQMRKTITVRLPDDIADWLSATAQKTGMAQGRLIREELEKARSAGKPSFMRLAGAVDGPADLSKRKGFSRK